jgi:hypothetical protein
MRLAFLIPLTLAGSVLMVGPASAGSGAADAVNEARALLARRDYQKATTVLEEALMEARPSDRAAIIELLRQSYRELIARAESSGKSRDAAAYRDNLAILEQAPGHAPGDPPAPPSRQADPVAPARPAEGVKDQRSAPGRVPRSGPGPDQALLQEPSPLPEPGPAPAPPLEGPGPARPPAAASRPIPRQGPPSTGQPSAAKALPGTDQTPPIVAERPDSEPAAKPARSDPELQRTRVQGAPGRGSAESALDQADRLFLDKKYEQAGRIYAQLAGRNQLPAQRKGVWAYCRWVAVVARINAHPRSDHEWDQIEQEVRSIQRLTPGNWYGEYLQNRVAEARRGGRAPARSGRLVVRGSAPEEDPPARLPRLAGRSRSAPPSSPGLKAESGEPALGFPSPPAEERPQADPRGEAPGIAASGPTSMAAAPRSGSESQGQDSPPATPVSWHVRETANFTIYHTDPVLAEQAAKAAEAARAQQAKRWGSTATRFTWSPRCELYLYPTPGDFARMTGQPETSPGFSTMGINGNRIIARRVHLRANHPQLLTAILPHEVTHVVLADLFTQQQIPRWADEGMAVLAEPPAEQVNRAAELIQPLKEGRVFKLSELMAIDYPNAEAWNLYYAQSVSLTQYLVGLGTPEQFVSFVRGAQRNGIEESLRTVYRIDGFAELEDRWQDFARRQAGEITASSRDSGTATDTSRRR